ncbi:cell division protein SepF, partial [Streptomyces sp. SID5770]|nr:cell division protein SepF [Streptomyces sp. SID5770]
MRYLEVGDRPLSVWRFATDAKQLVDFVTGRFFGLHSSVERMTQNVFLMLPASVWQRRRKSCFPCWVHEFAGVPTAAWESQGAHGAPERRWQRCPAQTSRTTVRSTGNPVARSVRLVSFWRWSQPPLSPGGSCANCGARPPGSPASSKPSSPFI